MEQGAKDFKEGGQNWNFQEEAEKLGDADYPKIQQLILSFLSIFEVSPSLISRGFSSQKPTV